MLIFEFVWAELFLFNQKLFVVRESFGDLGIDSFKESVNDIGLWIMLSIFFAKQVLRIHLVLDLGFCSIPLIMLLIQEEVFKPPGFLLVLLYI